MCPIPRNKIELSNMGERAIKSHAKGKKHCDRLALYIQNSCIKFTLVSTGSAKSPGASSTSTFSSSLDKLVVPEAATDAEISWCLKIVVSSYSFGSCDELADMFRSMFPESTIGQKFCLQKGKCAYFINYDIAPHFRSIRMDNVKDSEFYAISFDESLKTVIEMGQMDLVANFWDNVANNCALVISTQLPYVMHDTKTFSSISFQHQINWI